MFPLPGIASCGIILARTILGLVSVVCLVGGSVKLTFCALVVGKWLLAESLHCAGICNRMENENTPTKTFVRVDVAESNCEQCSELVDNTALRRRLFTVSQKTKTCLNLEHLLERVFRCVRSARGRLRAVFKVSRMLAVFKVSRVWQCARPSGERGFHPTNV